MNPFTNTRNNRKSGLYVLPLLLIFVIVSNSQSLYNQYQNIQKSKDTSFNISGALLDQIENGIAGTLVEHIHNGEVIGSGFVSGDGTFSFESTFPTGIMDEFGVDNPMLQIVSSNPISSDHVVMKVRSTGEGFISILDLRGQAIESLSLQANNEYHISWGGSSQPSGIYFVYVFDNKGNRAVEKLVLQKGNNEGLKKIEDYNIQYNNVFKSTQIEVDTLFFSLGGFIEPFRYQFQHEKEDVDVGVIETNVAPQLIQEFGEQITDYSELVTIPVPDYIYNDGDSEITSANPDIVIDGNNLVYQAPNYDEEISSWITVRDETNPDFPPVMSRITLKTEEQVSNQKPVALDDEVSTAYETNVEINVLENDYDPDGNLDPSSVKIDESSQAQIGSVEINPQTGVVSYTPDAGVFGTDIFNYIVSDDGNPVLSDTAQITVNIGEQGNVVPVAVDDEVSIDEDTNALIPVLENDYDPDGNLDPGSLDTTGLLQPQSGTIKNIDLVNSMIEYAPIENFSGNDSFQYKISDTEGLSAVATVMITVLEINDKPIAVNDYANTPYETNVTIDVAANDYDVDGTIDLESISIEGVLQPGKGKVTILIDGKVLYEPYEGESGQDLFEYIIFDDGSPALSDTAQVRVQIAEFINNPPIAVDDYVEIDEDENVNIDVAANDVDPDGNLDPTSVSIEGLLQPQHGSVSVDETGQISYITEPNHFGTDSFEYEIFDTQGLSDIGLVTITKNPVNDAPNANDDFASAAYQTSISVNVANNDTDIDGQVLPESVSIEGLLEPGNGTILSVNNGVIEYLPNDGFSGEDVFEYMISDDANPALWDTAYVNISVGSPGNAPPNAVDDNAELEEDSSVFIDVLANDNDPDGNLDPTSVTNEGLLQPAHGSIVINPSTGAIEYTPYENYFGTDAFEYQVFDTEGLSDVGYVSLNILPKNDNPIASNDNANTDEDVPVTIDVLANDYDPDGSIDPTTVEIVQNPGHGSAEVDPVTGEITYLSANNWYGTDYINYTVKDNEGAVSNVATVSITVNPVNDAPVAVDDNADTDEDIAVQIAVLDNDYDIDGTVDPTSVSNAGLLQPQHGAIAIDAVSGIITYTPDANWNGTDSFEYLVYDDLLAQSNIATVTIIVDAVNDAPVAVDDNAGTDEDIAVQIAVLDNDYDTDGTVDPTSVSNAGLLQPQNGAIAIDAVSGIITYTPDENWNGTDSFEYVVYDDLLMQSNIAMVTVAVNAVNDAPVAMDDNAGTDEDIAVQIAVLDNDYDIDGTIDPTSVSNAGLLQPQNGAIAIDAVSGIITYTPEANWNGTDSFEYLVYDDLLAQSNIATVTVVVDAVNDAPVAVDDNANTDEDEAVVINVLDNDYDLDGAVDPTTVSGDGLLQPQNGNLSIDAVTGAITYAPGENWHGTDSFEYVVSDDLLLQSNVATVTVVVNSINDAPVAVADYDTTAWEEPITIAVLGNDYDVDGTIDPTSVTNSGLLQPENGIVAINPNNGEIIYTPEFGYSGTDSLEYQVYDDEGLISNVAKVYITVEEPSMVDVTFQFKDAALDTNITGETCTLYYRKEGWTEDSTKVSTTGSIMLPMEVGATYEINGEHSGDWESQYNLDPIYLAMKRPAELEAFEQRALSDETSPITIQAGESSIDLYKLDETYPISDLRSYASYLNGMQEGIRKFATSDADAPFWVDLNNGGQNLTAEQEEWYNDIKTDLQSVPHVYVNLPLQQSTTIPTSAYNSISIKMTNPSTPSNYTTFNNSTHEIETANSLFNQNYPFSEYDFKQEFFEAFGDLNDVGGSPNIMNGPSQNYTLNTTGRDIFAVMYLFKPGTEF
jgi:hypothetical protein